MARPMPPAAPVTMPWCRRARSRQLHAVRGRPAHVGGDAEHRAGAGGDGSRPLGERHLPRAGGDEQLGQRRRLRRRSWSGTAPAARPVGQRARPAA